KKNRNSARNRVDAEPLEKLVGAVVAWVIIHPHRRTPLFASVHRSRTKDVDIAIAVITPGHIKVGVFVIAAARVDSDLGKSVGAIEILHRKHCWPASNYVLHLRKCFAAVARR